jgi:hypothetical protein
MKEVIVVFTTAAQVIAIALGMSLVLAALSALLLIVAII